MAEEINKLLKRLLKSRLLRKMTSARPASGRTSESEVKDPIAFAKIYPQFKHGNSAPPDVSVIVPTYNVSAFIEECIESILKQRDVSMEIIIVDDKSTDDTLQKLEKYTKIPIVRIIPLEQNIGQARARNLALDQARGEFIAFLDSDDYFYKPNVLIRCVMRARNQSADMIRSNYVRVNADGLVLSEDISGLDCEDRGAGSVAQYPELVNTNACWQLLYRRQFLIDNDLRFSEKLRQREDRLFFLQCLIRAERIIAVAPPAVAYRIRDGQTMSRIDWDQFTLWMAHMSELNKFFDDYLPSLSLEKRAGLQPFLHANALAYLRSMAQYWKPLLAQDGAYRRPEFQGMVQAISRLGVSDSRFRDDRILRIPDKATDLRDGYFYDLLRALCVERQYKAVWTLLVRGMLPLTSAEACIAASSEPIELARLLNNSYAHFRPNFSGAGKKKVKSTISLTARTMYSAADNPPEIILHYGMPKTGSSAIQAFFEANRIQLARKGIWYPIVGVERGRAHRIDRTAGHAQLINNILFGDGSLLGEMLMELASLPVKPKQVVISVENVLSHRFWRDDQTLRTLFDAFGIFPLRVVTFLRRQHDWLESMYNEVGNNPGNDNIVEDPMSFFQHQYYAGYLFYDELCAEMECRLGKDRVQLLCYESCRSEGGSVDAFLAALGISREGSVSPAADTANLSGSILLGRFLIECNRRKMPVDKKVQFFLEQRGNPNLAIKGLRHYSMTERRAIFDAFRSSNESFIRMRPEFAPVLEWREEQSRAVTWDDVKFLDGDFAAFETVREVEEDDAGVTQL